MPISDPTATLDQAALLTTAQLKLSGDVRCQRPRGWASSFHSV
jgi:hypothetical protein